MPSNTDYLLERYLEEENLPQFILTCSIYNGFFPSNKLLKQFGSGYGPDNWIHSHEDMFKEKLSYEYKLDKLLNPKDGDEDDLKREINKAYEDGYKQYLKWFEYYNTDMKKLWRMDERVRKFNAENDIESKFLRFITNYISDQKDLIREKYKKRLEPPVKETLEEAKERLVAELTGFLENLKWRLLFNDSFFEDISKKWLR